MVAHPESRKGRVLASLGNGLAETRGFDARYFPERLEVPGRLLQTYTTDPVGNILGMTRTVGTQSFSMAFAYQDPQYFLTQGNGPWGQQSWTTLARILCVSLIRWAWR